LRDALHGPRRSATKADVTTGQTGSSANAASSDAYEAVRADDSIQYAPIEIEPPPEPPSWLSDLFEFLAKLFEPLGKVFGASWPVMKWVLIAVGIALLLYLLWKLLAPVLDLKSRASIETEEWVPVEAEAIALLEEADRLAAAGDYDEATHLLLKRSVGQIADARPEWVDPSSTARELAALPALPQAARNAFGTIAERVERSLFALRKLGADDWQAARAAYAEFALQSLRENTA
jgi:hypothetical protein